MATPATKEFSTYTQVTPAGADTFLLSDASDSGATKEALISDIDTALGLGTMSTQAANSVAITGGTLDSVTVTNIDLNSGSIDGTAIGANSASTLAATTGAFSSDVTVSGSVTATNFIGDGTALTGVLLVDSWQGAWVTSTAYSVNDLVSNDGSTYIATSAHTSGASTEPGTGASWTTVWDLFLAPGTGDISGALGANDNRLVRSDGAGGTTIQASVAALTDAGVLSGLTGLTIASGTINFNGATISDLGTVSTADINGGTIDGAVIGGSSAAAITGTTVTQSGDHVFTASEGLIRTDTSDASDTKSIKIGGGGDLTTSRGAFIVVAGNEQASIPGELRLFAGNVSGGAVKVFTGGANLRQMWDENGGVFIGDTSNANMTQGLTINQGANDDEALAFKSSDVAHGVTGLTETDTYGFLKKNIAAEGGLLLEGVSSGTIGFGFSGTATTEETTRSTSAKAAFMLTAALKSGTSRGVLGANGNLVAIKNYTGTKWLVDAEGDTHADAVHNDNAWDDENDIGLLSTFRSLQMSRNAASRFFGEWATDAKNKQILHDTGVITITPREDGGEDVFYSQKGLFALVIDALRQTNKRLESVEQKLLT